MRLSFLLVATTVLLSANAFAFTFRPTRTGKIVPTRSRSRSTCSRWATIDEDADPAILKDKEEQELAAKTKALCAERNLPFQKVKNARDLASVKNSPVKSGKIYRMGRLGDATAQDQELLWSELGIKTLVDLRSPTELKDDPALLSDVFSNFTDLVWKEKGRKKEGCVFVLEHGESPVNRRRRQKKEKVVLEVVVAEEDELCDLDCDDPESLPATKMLQKTVGRRERHFVSLMNEFKYVRGTLSHLRKRDLAKSVLKSPGAVVSKRVWTSLKKPFLREINNGGLKMLNELLLRFGAPGIKHVLDLCAEKERHPIAFYCTAGKDRTGMLTAIILSLCGVKPEDIVEDYSLSANVYAEMNDHQAMVGALSQRSLDPKTFLGAPPQAMRDTLVAIEEHYGSVEEYCNWIGFGPEQQQKLREAVLND
jgi:protein tyrosine/serine phosphatase